MDLKCFFESQGILFLSIHYSISIVEQKSNMNTKQFSLLFVLVLFKSQVILLVLSKSQGIWSVERNGLFFFKSQGIWFFTLFSFNLMIGTHHDLMKQMFWFFFKSQVIYLLLSKSQGIWSVERNVLPFLGATVGD